MSGKVLPSPAQRASIEPATARSSSGNSRMMRRALPVSMYFDFSAGKMLLWKLAQWPQVIEAYSTMVTGASVWPNCSSGKGPAFISSATGTSVTFPLLRLGLAVVDSLDEDRNQADAAARTTTPAPANSMLRRD